MSTLAATPGFANATGVAPREGSHPVGAQYDLLRADTVRNPIGKTVHIEASAGLSPRSRQ
jgi:hypothetical protein